MICQRRNTGKGAYLALERSFELGNAQPCCGAGAQCSKARARVCSIEPIGRVNVDLIDADEELTARFFGNDRYTVDKKWVSDGVRVGGNKDQSINICDGWSYKAVFSIKNFFYKAFSVLIYRKADLIADKW